VLRGLLFLDEAYEKMARIHCQGNPTIRELLIVIGLTLINIGESSFFEIALLNDEKIRWEEAARHTYFPEQERSFGGGPRATHPL